MPPTDLPAQESAADPIPVVAPAPQKLPKDISLVPNKSLGALLDSDQFGGDHPDPAKPEPVVPAKKAATKVAKSAPKPAEVDDDDDEGEDDSEAPPEEDADDVDFDKPAEEPEPAKEDDPEDPKDESLARIRAKENGQRAKKAEAALTLAESENNTLRERLAVAEATAKELKAVKVRPADDPEYRRMFNDVRSSVESESELIKGASNVWENFSGFIGSYVEAKVLTGSERKTAINALKQEIIAKCGSYELGFEDMDDLEKDAAEAMATSVLKVVMNNTGKAEAVMELHDRLSKDAELGTTVVREREYKEAVGRIQPDLDALGDLDAETIAKNPHSIEAMIADTIAGSPAARTLSEKAKEEIRDVIAGLQPLSRKEVEKLKAQGTNLKDYEAARQAKHDAKVKKFIRLAFKGAMSATVFGKKLEEWAILKGEADAEESEDTAIRKAVKPPKKKPADDYVRPSQRANYGLGRFSGDD